MTVGRDRQFQTIDDKEEKLAVCDRDKEIFRDIYAYLYDLTQKVNKGLVVDQAALMQGAIALFKYRRCDHG